MIKGVAGQSIGCQMVNATTGAAFTGTVTVYITLDAGTQAIGTVGSGVCTHEGNGYHTYLPSLAETSGDLIAFTFIGTGAIPVTIQVATVSQLQTTALSQVTGTSANRGLTVSDLITRSLQDLNIVAAGDTPSPDDMALGFIRLNDLIDDLKNDNLLVYTTTRTTWTLGSGTASYTIGNGATVNVLRPVSAQQIHDIGYIDTAVSPTLEITFGGCLTEQDYQNIAQKALTTPYPTGWYYNPTFGATGFGTLSPLPIPTLATLQGVIYTDVPVDEFNALSDVILVPPGYRRLFRNLLTVEIAAAFEKQAPRSVLEAIETTQSRIKASNLRMVDMGFAVGVPTVARSGGYSIWSDD